MPVSIWRLRFEKIAEINADDDDVEAIISSFDTLDDYENTIIYLVTKSAVEKIPGDVRDRNREVIEALLKAIDEDGGSIWVQIA